MNTEGFLRRGREILDEFDRAGKEAPHILTNAGQQAAVEELEAACERVQSPMQRLEHALHPWVAFGIVPLFALANAGVALGGGIGDALAQPVTLGIVAGLVVGKQVGVMLFAWGVVCLRLADLPEDVGWRHIYGAGLLAGIGFTMSLFIGSLAFGEGELLDAAKTGILVASMIAGVSGWLVLRTGRTVEGQDAGQPS